MRESKCRHPALKMPSTQWSSQQQELMAGKAGQAAPGRVAGETAQGRGWPGSCAK